MIREETNAKENAEDQEEGSDDLPSDVDSMRLVGWRHNTFPCLQVATIYALERGLSNKEEF